MVSRCCAAQLDGSWPCSGPRNGIKLVARMASCWSSCAVLHRSVGTLGCCLVDRDGALDYYLEHRFRQRRERQHGTLPRRIAVVPVRWCLHFYRQPIRASHLAWRKRSRRWSSSADFVVIGAQRSPPRAGRRAWWLGRCGSRSSRPCMDGEPIHCSTEALQRGGSPVAWTRDLPRSWCDRKMSLVVRQEIELWRRRLPVLQRTVRETSNSSRWLRRRSSPSRGRSPSTYGGDGGGELDDGVWSRQPA